MKPETRTPKLALLCAATIFALSACGGGDSGSGGGGSSGSSFNITTGTLPGGTVGLAYNAPIAADAGLGIYVWSVTGTLPTGLTLNTASSTETTTLSGIPLAAGSFNFTVQVDAGGETASRPYTVVIGSSGFPAGTPVTDVTVSNTVLQPGVKRLGINIGGHDRWGASKILKNIIPNPGFESGHIGTVWLAATGSTSGNYTPALWGTASGNQPAGFWDGAQWEIPYGAAAGQSGTVSSFTHAGANYNFNLGAGSTAMSQYDVLFTRRAFPGTAYGVHGNVGTADTSNPYSGLQSLRMAASQDFSHVMDTSWRDGDQSSHKLHVIEGQWRVRLKARSQNGSEQVRVRFYRDGGAPYNPTFIDQTFTAGTGWSTHEFTANIAAGTDQTNDPWPAGYKPALIFRVNTPAGNAGNLWIDELELTRIDDATNPTAFTDRFVDRLQELQPGILRWWGGQLGETLENMTRPWAERGTNAYKPSETTPGNWNYGVHDFFVLCQHIGAEPWLVMPPTASQQDLLDFMEYLAGTSGTYATRRVNQGQTAPWTSVFPRIHLEWGNELWGSGDPGDPFGGASVRGGVRLGQCADRAFTLMKSSPWYAGVAGVLDMVIGGQAGYAGRQQEIEANANDHDSTALAPYFGELSTWASDAEIYGPLFAKPFYDCLHANGRLFQSNSFLQAGGNGTRMSFYEINYHTTGVIAGLPTTLRNEFVAGASGAIALPLNMLLPLREFGCIDQCAFLTLGYSYRFQNTGSWQDDYVQVWGMLRDLYHYNTRRPTWLGMQVVNEAIRGDMVTTAQTGDNPSWTQSAINGVGAATTVNHVQSFAFRSGTQYGIVLMNLSLTQQQGVRLHTPGTPSANATIYRIEPPAINTMNDTTEPVNIQTDNVTTFSQAYEMILPPHSIRTIVWSN